MDMNQFYAYTSSASSKGFILELTKHRTNMEQVQGNKSKFFKSLTTSTYQQIEKPIQYHSK